MTAVLLAIDPGARSGFALLGADGSLVDSGSEPRERLRARLGAYRHTPVCVVELPYYRDPIQTPGNPNQLIVSAWHACDIARQIIGPDALLHAVVPHDWKGRIEKRIHHNRFGKDHCPPGWRARWDAAKSRLDERDAIAMLHWFGTKAGIVCR